MKPYFVAGFDIDINVISLASQCSPIHVREGVEVGFELAVNQVCRIGAKIHI